MTLDLKALRELLETDTAYTNAHAWLALPALLDEIGRLRRLLGEARWHLNGGIVSLPALDLKARIDAALKEGK